MIFGQSFYGSISSAIKRSKVYLNSEGIDKTVAPKKIASVFFRIFTGPDQSIGSGCALIAEV